MIYWFIISSLWFDIWVTLSRLEFKYAGLNVSKNKFGLNFFIWNMQAWMEKKKNLGLNVGKKKSGLFFFFWLGHDLGPISKRGPAGAGLGPGKKPGTLNGAGLGHGSCPAGRVRVWKNAARTRPVAIPNYNDILTTSYI